MKVLRILILLGLLISCDNNVEVTVPIFGDNEFLEGTLDIPASAKIKMEGLYKVEQGNDFFGERVVLKWNKNKLSIFGEKHSVYFITNTGSDGMDIKFEGYWRFAVNNETGLTRLVISADNGGSGLLADTSSVDGIYIDGYYGNNNDSPNISLSLRYERPFSQKAINTKFYVIAHRGGGRTSDNLPASENTVEILNLTEVMGGNAIEIDVKLSKDRVPFLYHDRTINLRLVQKSVIWGNIEDFTFSQLRSLITLINGEKIPTLREVMEYVLEKTTIEFVYLDMKSEKYDIPEVVEIQLDILQRAENMGRTLDVYLGLPTETKIDHFMSFPGWENVPSLNEFEPEDVRKTNSQVWAPRWTLGLQNENVLQLQSEGRKVVNWTMDDAEFIQKFMNEGHCNGMVTNYPSLVAYYHYSR